MTPASFSSPTAPARRLECAAVRPEHAWLHDARRVEYTDATDEAALDAITRLVRLEGLIPALESLHTVAEANQRAPKLGRDAATKTWRKWRRRSA
jgi:tryptophan synthase beta subunit